VDALAAALAAGQRDALLAALDAATALARNVAGSTNLPSQPTNVVKDGRSPAGCPSFWYAFTSHFGSLLGAAAAAAAAAPASTTGGAMPAAHPLPYRAVSAGLSMPLGALRLATSGISGDDECMDGSHTGGAGHHTGASAGLAAPATGPPSAPLLAPGMADEFVAQWNVRAQAPAAGAPPAAAASARVSAPRIRLLSFFTLPPRPSA